MNPLGFFKFATVKRHGLAVVIVSALMSILVLDPQALASIIKFVSTIGALYLMWLNYGDLVQDYLNQGVNHGERADEGIESDSVPDSSDG